MAEEEKKVITREKHPGRVAQGHKFAAYMKKRKEEILHSKEQSTVQGTVQRTVQGTVQPKEYSAVQETVHSNGTYVYSVGIVVAIGVCVFFAYLKIKKLINDCLTAQHQ